MDQDYEAKQFQFLKAMAQKFEDYATILFLDDKATIPAGHQHAPVSAARRQRKILAAGVGPKGLKAYDHNLIPMHLTPLKI